MTPTHGGGLPRIGITGIGIESSTFSPHRATLDDFSITRDDALLARYEFLAAPGALRAAADWTPILHARSLPGGAVTAETFNVLLAETVERLRAAVATAPLDGLYLDIHGAMSVVGRTDAEADLIEAIRAVIGPDTLVSASMDLHGNVSRRLAEAVDLITCYREAPHIDAWETRERAVRHLVDRLALPPAERRPHKAWVQVPVLLPGEKTSTRVQPARGVYDKVHEAAAAPGILDAALWVGYAWADEPRCQAAVVVTGDDAAATTARAAELATAYWDARADFAFVAPAAPLADCLRQAFASAARPFYISDSGDNPTAGGAGDTSWTLDALLRTPEIVGDGLTTLYAAIVDPEVAATAARAGVGATIGAELGGKTDSGPCGPVPITARVAAVDDADPVAGTAVALAVGGLRVIVTARRKPYHLEADFTALGLDPRSADLVIVKIGYLEPELYAMAAGWLLALTPGGVDQDLPRLGHHRIERPMYPFDPDMPAPDLTPTLLR